MTNKVFRCAVLSVLLMCSLMWSCPFSVGAVDETEFEYFIGFSGSSSYYISAKSFDEASELYSMFVSEFPEFAETGVSMVDDSDVMAVADASTLTSSNTFSFQPACLSSDSMIFKEDLPYGTDTSVFAFRRSNNYSYFFFLSGSAPFVVGNTYDEASDQYTVSILSYDYSPWRYGIDVDNGYVIRVDGVYGLTKSYDTSKVNDAGRTVFTYEYGLPSGNSYQCVCDPVIGQSLSGTFGIATYPSFSSYSNILQESQNSILDEQNGLIEEGNSLVDEQNSILNDQNTLIQEGNSIASDINDALNESGDSDFSTTLPTDSISEYNDLESGLVDDYDPDNIEDDLDVELDESALSVIWDIFDDIVRSDNQVFAVFISCLAIGIISLILGR